MKIKPHTATLIYQNVYMKDGKIVRFDNKILRRAQEPDVAKTYKKITQIERQKPAAPVEPVYEDDFEADESRSASPLPLAAIPSDVWGEINRIDAKGVDVVDIIIQQGWATFKEDPVEPKVPELTVGDVQS